MHTLAHTHTHTDTHTHTHSSKLSATLAKVGRISFNCTRCSSGHFIAGPQKLVLVCNNFFCFGDENVEVLQCSKVGQLFIKIPKIFYPRNKTKLSSSAKCNLETTVVFPSIAFLPTPKFFLSFPLNVILMFLQCQKFWWFCTQNWWVSRLQKSNPVPLLFL